MKVAKPDDRNWPTHCDWCRRPLDREWTFVGTNPHCGRSDCFVVTQRSIERDRACANA